MSVEKRMQMLSLYWILISLRLLNVRGKGKKWTLKLITQDMQLINLIVDEQKIFSVL